MAEPIVHASYGGVALGNTRGHSSAGEYRLIADYPLSLF